MKRLSSLKERFSVLKEGPHLGAIFQVKEAKTLITYSYKDSNKTKENFKTSKEKLKERKLNQNGNKMMTKL